MAESKSVTVGWFEVPVTNMKRAMEFYGSIFDIELSEQDFGNLSMAFFPQSEGSGGAPGALVETEGHYTTSHEGCLLYFSCDDLSNELSRVEESGGKVLKHKTEISPDYGFMGLFEDSEGNRIALHSMQ